MGAGTPQDIARQRNESHPHWHPETLRRQRLPTRGQASECMPGMRSAPRTHVNWAQEARVSHLAPLNPSLSAGDLLLSWTLCATWHEMACVMPSNSSNCSEGFLPACTDLVICLRNTARCDRWDFCALDLSHCHGSGVHRAGRLHVVG